MEVKAASSTWKITFRTCAHQRGIPERNKMIKPLHELPVVRECKALQLQRKTIYREPRPVRQIDPDLRTLIDSFQMQSPECGCRMLRDRLKALEDLNRTESLRHAYLQAGDPLY